MYITLMYCTSMQWGPDVKHSIRAPDVKGQNIALYALLKRKLCLIIS